MYCGIKNGLNVVMLVAYVVITKFCGAFLVGRSKESLERSRIFDILLDD